MPVVQTESKLYLVIYLNFIFKLYLPQPFPSYNCGVFFAARWPLHNNNSSWYFTQTILRESSCPAERTAVHQSCCFSCKNLSPGLPRLSWNTLYWQVLHYQVLHTEQTNIPQNQGNKPTQINKKYRTWDFWSDFPFLIGQGELRGEQELATCFSNVTFCNCFYLNTEMRTEGPLGAVTPTSSATVPAAAVFELLMCLTTDLHSTLHAPDVLGFPNTSVLNHTKPGLSNVHTPLPDTASSSELVTRGGAAGV